MTMPAVDLDAVTIIDGEVALCGLIGAVFLAMAVRWRKRRHPLVGGFQSISALAFFLAAAVVGLIGSGLLGYQRLVFEQPAAELTFHLVADQDFNADITYPDGSHQQFELRGDEWQVDARVLKWTGFANLLGFNAAYRLERISGRYRDIQDERTLPRTVHLLHPPDRVDTWNITRRYQRWLPGIDALYGSATFLPMADDARFEIKVTQSGLIARPLNEPGRDAVTGWQ